MKPWPLSRSKRNQILVTARTSESAASNRVWLIRTPYRAPKCNAYAERFVRSIKSRQGQPVTSFRTGSVSPPFRFSAASITSIALSQTRRDFLRSTGGSRRQ